MGFNSGLKGLKEFEGVKWEGQSGVIWLRTWKSEGLLSARSCPSGCKNCREFLNQRRTN